MVLAGRAKWHVWLFTIKESPAALIFLFTGLYFYNGYFSQAGWTHTGPDTIGELDAATGLRPACTSTILDEPHRGAAGGSESPASSATSSRVKTTLFPPPRREVLMRVLLARGGTGVTDRHGAGARQATITPAGVSL